MITRIFVFLFILVSGHGFAEPGSHLPAATQPGTAPVNRPSAGQATSLETLPLRQLVNRLNSEHFQSRVAAEREIRRRLAAGPSVLADLQAIYTPGRETAD